MEAYNYSASSDFDAVTAAIRRYVETELRLTICAACSIRYDYAIKLAGFSDIGRDYSLKVRDEYDDRDWEAFQMVETLAMPYYPQHFTGMCPDEFRLFLLNIIDQKASNWERLQPVYRHICEVEDAKGTIEIGWNDVNLSKEQRKTLSECGITAQCGGVRIQCRASRIMERDVAPLDADRSSRRSVTREGYIAVGFEGSVNPDRNYFFSFKILRRLLQVLHEYHTDTFYRYDVKSDFSNRGIDFWRSAIFDNQ